MRPANDVDRPEIELEHQAKVIPVLSDNERFGQVSGCGALGGLGLGLGGSTAQIRDRQIWTSCDPG